MLCSHVRELRERRQKLHVTSQIIITCKTYNTPRKICINIRHMCNAVVTRFSFPPPHYQRAWVRGYYSMQAILSIVICNQAYMYESLANVDMYHNKLEHTVHVRDNPCIHTIPGFSYKFLVQSTFKLFQNINCILVNRSRKCLCTPCRLWLYLPLLQFLLFNKACITRRLKSTLKIHCNL